jgi:hypothetical protein
MDPRLEHRSVQFVCLRQTIGGPCRRGSTLVESDQNSSVDDLGGAAAPDDDDDDGEDELGFPQGRRVEEEDPDVDRDEVVVEHWTRGDPFARGLVFGVLVC